MCSLNLVTFARGPCLRVVEITFRGVNVKVVQDVFTHCQKNQLITFTSIPPLHHTHKKFSYSIIFPTSQRRPRCCSWRSPCCRLAPSSFVPFFFLSLSLYIPSEKIHLSISSSRSRPLFMRSRLLPFLAVQWGSLNTRSIQCHWEELDEDFTVRQIFVMSVFRLETRQKK